MFLTCYASICCLFVPQFVVCLTEQLSAVPQFANLGPLFKSSAMPLELTESETEYSVRCVKHMFPHHIVFQVSGATCSGCHTLSVVYDCRLER